MFDRVFRGLCLCGALFSAGFAVVVASGCGNSPPRPTSAERTTELNLHVLVKVTESYRRVDYPRYVQDETYRVVVELVFVQSGKYVIRLWSKGFNAPDTVVRELRYEAAGARVETIDVGARFDRIEVVYSFEAGATHTVQQAVQYAGVVWRNGDVK